MTTQGRIRQAWFSALVLGCFCLSLGAQSIPSTQTAQSTKAVKVESALVRPFIQGFETALNIAAAASFPGPFGVEQKARGFYMPGFGYEFIFAVNTRRGVVQTPFGAYDPDADKTPEQRKQRVEELKGNLVRILLSAGNGAVKLQKDEYVAIIAVFEERDPVNPDGNLSKTLILSVLKSDLDELANKQERYSELKQRVKIVEY
ncbi:MAG: hypothetical protein LAP85_19275 [Acidobacteriia bacterium]|nr:hypothetical protein [Terriglobia bacterium]